MGMMSRSSPRRDDVRIAIGRFERDFGLDLNDSPFGLDVRADYQRLAAGADLSRDAKTALLYRLFVQRALAQGEHETAPDKAALLTALDALIRRAEAYSEAAPDHLAFEAATAPLNAWIARRMAEATSAGHA